MTKHCHPSSAYPKSRSVPSQASACSCHVSNSDYSKTSLLKKQVADIQAQITALKQSPDQKSPKNHFLIIKYDEVGAVKSSVTQGLQQSNAEESEIAKL